MTDARILGDQKSLLEKKDLAQTENNIKPYLDCKLQQQRRKDWLYL